MAKKNTGSVVGLKNRPVDTAGATAFGGWEANGIAAVVGILLYLGVHFIPYSGAIDPMGPQWLYVVWVDLVVTGWILLKKETYGEAVRVVFRNICSRIFLALLALALLSVPTAINATEAWVCVVRLIATVIGFLNISFLLHGRLKLFPLLAWILSGILLFESVQTLTGFYGRLGTMSLDQVILSLQGNTGLKNIFAAALVVKIPFVLYGLYTTRHWQRLVHIVILILGVLAIFIVNARSAYVGLAGSTVLYLLFCVLQHVKERKTEQLLYRISYLLLPLLCAFFVSQIILANAQNSQENQGAYGTVVERLGTISYSGGGRAEHWESTIDYIRDHLFWGCGYGNWKIASLPVQKTWGTELTVPIHSHNDFLELSAELGIPGGLLYGALFLFLLLGTIRTWMSKAAEENKLAAAFSLMALAAFFVDANLNFPMERPIMQVFFALLVALHLTAFHSSNKKETETDAEANKTAPMVLLFSLSSFLVLLPAAYTSYLSHRSMVAQMRVLPDIRGEELKISAAEVNASFPDMPNLTTKGQPIDAIKGRYYFYEKQYERALELLDKGAKANPYAMYSEFIKANLYNELNKPDSAIYYASRAFYARPRASAYFYNLMVFTSKNNDTAAMGQAFREYRLYNPGDSRGWVLYLSGMVIATKKDSKKLSRLADTALQLFPANAELLQLKQQITGNTATATVPAKQGVSAEVYLNNAIHAFNKGDYATAAENFANLSTLNPNDYGIYENAGISYFNMGAYAKAITWLDKSLALKSTDGKSEFFKGKSLLALNRKAEGCALIQIAQSKGYPEATAILNEYCQ